MRRELTARERRGAALIVLALAVWAGWWLLVQSWFLDPLMTIENQADSLREQQQRYAGVLQQRDALQQPAAAGPARPGQSQQPAAWPTPAAWRPT